MPGMVNCVGEREKQKRKKRKKRYETNTYQSIGTKNKTKPNTKISKKIVLVNSMPSERKPEAVGQMYQTRTQLG
jgi:hypothetical protein